jgi:hypothetical protein
LENSDFGLIAASAEALATLGDARGLPVFEAARKKTSSAFLTGILEKSEERLRQSASATAPRSSAN